MDRFQSAGLAVATCFVQNKIGTYGCDSHEGVSH